MRIDWNFSAAGNSSSINPAWTETAVCAECGLNSRMRTLFDLLKTRFKMSSIRHAYIAEQVTVAYRTYKTIFPALLGSEYLGSDYPSGKIFTRWHNLTRIRHKDLTDLSFADGQFDLAITQDVFEHIPTYRKAFTELYRVLSSGGRLLFTIPFFDNLENTRIRASMGSEGIVHLLPVEIHGNPVSNEGSLCFQNFGWDILEDLKKAGFKETIAHLYWGPWQGHLGYPMFVFSALKE
jgi:SAM-dependent methyltransferase